MNKILLYSLFLIVGAAIGSVVTGYISNNILKRWTAMSYAAQLGTTANDALAIKSGDSSLLLETHERTIKAMVAELSENESLRNTAVTDVSLQAAKRFYVCTNTPIPAEIDGFLRDVKMLESGCGN